MSTDQKELYNAQVAHHVYYCALCALNNNRCEDAATALEKHIHHHAHAPELGTARRAELLAMLPVLRERISSEVATVEDTLRVWEAEALETIAALSKPKSKLDQALEDHVPIDEAACANDWATPTEIQAALKGERVRRGQYVAAIELLRNGAYSDAIEVLRELRGERGGALDVRRRDVLAAIIDRIRTENDVQHRKAVITELETMCDGVGNEVRRLEKLERFATAYNDPANLQTPKPQAQTTSRARRAYSLALSAVHIFFLVLVISSWIGIATWFFWNAALSVYQREVVDYAATYWLPFASVLTLFGSVFAIAGIKQLEKATGETEEDVAKRATDEAYAQYMRNRDAEDRANGVDH